MAEVLFVYASKAEKEPVKIIKNYEESLDFDVAFLCSEKKDKILNTSIVPGQSSAQKKSNKMIRQKNAKNPPTNNNSINSKWCENDARSHPAEV